MTLIRQANPVEAQKWRRDQSQTLRDGLGTLGICATADQIAKMEAFANLLLKWNRTYNLLGATTADELVTDHLLDALATIPALERWLPKEVPIGRRPVIFDVGAGAGLPGLVLAIMLPAKEFVLVEPNGKKAAFIRQAIAHCELKNATVAEDRIEDLKIARTAEVPADATIGNYFICRAFTTLQHFAELCEPHTGQQSLLFAMKASRVLDEVGELANATILAIETLQSAGRDVQRNLVVMQPNRVAAALSGTSSS